MLSDFIKKVLHLCSENGLRGLEWHDRVINNNIFDLEWTNPKQTLNQQRQTAPSVQ